MRRPTIYALACVGLAACDNSSAPTAPTTEGRAPSYAISDGAHSGGNVHFYFLPPMLPAPPFSGVFDAGLSPVVEICALATSAACASGPLVASYSMTTGSGGELVTVDPLTEHYSVRWRTKDFNLSTSVIYRISVRIGTAQTLGFADVQVVLNNQQAKNVNTEEFIPLVNGRILPIMFRIERGAAGPPTITVDATPLSAPTVTVSGMGPFSTAVVQSFALAPGSYTLTYNAGMSQPSVTFAVTSAGFVDFAPALDGVLTGRGTTRLTVAGRAIQVDASSLSAPVFDVSYIIDDQPSSVLTSLTLLPGEHAVLYNAGASQPSVTFTVTAAGTVDYALGLDGVLAGRGTALLKVNGRTIQVDASALSVPVFDVSYIIDDQASSVVTSLTLLPGEHAVLYNAGASQPSVTVTVTPSGTIDYAPELDGVLSGRGTTLLKVNGRTIQVDASALSVPVFDISYILDDQPSSTVTSLTLLPGDHAVLYNAGASQPTVTFSMTVGGTVDYSSGLDGVLSGRGTAVLKIDGRTIQVDATALGISAFTLAFNGDFSAASVQALTLLPGGHHITADSRNFDFEVQVDGAVSYDAGLYPFLTGIGTTLLTIQ